LLSGHVRQKNACLPVCRHDCVDIARLHTILPSGPNRATAIAAVESANALLVA
jgi:hypothetical protein